MIVGIPRALLYYYYYPLWKVTFETLGIKIKVSQKTNKEQIDSGIRVSVSDICVPIKIFYGHLLELLNKDVDYVFVPRFMSIKKGEFFCPKFMGLPDMVRHGIPVPENKILMPEIESKDDDISSIKNYESLCQTLGVSEKDLKGALAEGQKAWLEFYKFCKKGYTALEGIDYVLNGKVPDEKMKDPILKIGLMGYVYDVYDEFVSMGIVDKLKGMQISIETFEMIEEQVLEDQLKNMKKRLFWSFSNKLIASGYKFLKDPSIDGIIHVTAFGCGPDSFIGKVMELESTEYKKPFMTIRVDEHTGENHLQTRVEAFVDMIYRKKCKSMERGIV